MPTAPPNLGQLLLLSASTLLFLFSFGIHLLNIRHQSNSLRLAAKSCIYWALSLGVASLIWHSITHQTLLPTGDNFAALAAVGLVLAGFILYVQRVRPIPALDLFLLPIVLLMLVSAIIFGRVKP